ncbi:MAG: sensor of ECF-type sigma factor [Bacteroidetes bacterium]|nr:sensor of ECF-type sigma factor [Bacteroidota bacterium]MBU1720713.1 sensor of ECF-type sigma factor [Bacteroidota bacterium]
MKKLSFILILTLLVQAPNLFAQDEKDGDKGNLKEIIKAEKIGFLTAKLELTSAEAEKFWPIYNAMQKEMDDLKKGSPKFHHVLKNNPDSLSDDELLTLMEKQMEFEQKMLDLRKKYHTQFVSVLPPKKLVKLHLSEEQFKRELLRRLKQNGQCPGGKHGGGPNHFIDDDD